MARGGRLAEAFAAVPRRDFLPPHQRGSADLDQALDIGFGVTNSQPRTVHDMLRLLDPRPGDRVLDVGSGSGWTTGLLAWLVGPQGSVTAVERIPELVDVSREVLADRFPAARVHLAEPGVLGRPADAPYDRVLVSAAADTLPQDLVDQLAPGGVLVVPVGGVMLRVTRSADAAAGDRMAGDGGIQVERHGRYRFVPLITDG